MAKNMERVGREVSVGDIPAAKRITVAAIFEEAKAHHASGKKTALAYYRTNSNLIPKLRKQGLLASARYIKVADAKRANIPHGKRGAVELFVLYNPALRGGPIPA